MVWCVDIIGSYFSIFSSFASLRAYNEKNIINPKFLQWRNNGWWLKLPSSTIEFVNPLSSQYIIYSFLIEDAPKHVGPNLVFGTSGCFFVTDGRTDGRIKGVMSYEPFKKLKKFGIFMIWYLWQGVHVILTGVHSTEARDAHLPGGLHDKSRLVVQQIAGNVAS